MSGLAHRATWRPMLLFAVGCAGMTGCESVLPRTTRIDSTAGMYQSATITYWVDTGALSEAVTVSRIQGRLVSFQPQPSSPFPKDSIARLSVQYPHPNGRSDFALAEVVIHSRRPLSTADTNAGKSTLKRWADSLGRFAQDTLPGVKHTSGVYEAWAFDVPKADLDRAIGQLAESGFYHLPPNPTAGVEISTRLDRIPMHKQWKRVPQLDALMQRVREEGKLVSYTLPLDAPQPLRFGPRRRPPLPMPPNLMLARSGSPYAGPSGQQPPPFGPPQGTAAINQPWPSGRQPQFGGQFANQTRANPFAPQQGFLPVPRRNWAGGGAGMPAPGSGGAPSAQPDWLARRPAVAHARQRDAPPANNWHGSPPGSTWPASYAAAPGANSFAAQGVTDPALQPSGTNAAPGAGQLADPYWSAVSAAGTRAPNPLAAPGPAVANPASFQAGAPAQANTTPSPFVPATPAVPSPLSDSDSDAKSAKPASSDAGGFFSNLGGKLQKFKSW